MNKERIFKNRILLAVRLANEDTVGKQIAKRMVDGKLIVKITDGICMNIQITDGRLELVESSDNARAIYEFGDLDSACGLLDKELSPYAATVHKQLKLQGLATLNDAFESLLLLAYEQENGLR